MVGALLKRRGIIFLWEEDFVSIKDDAGKPEVLANGSVNKRTTVRFIWKEKELDGRELETKFSVTWAQMSLAGYTEKQNWLKYPKEMMRARCLAYGARALFPEVFSGIYTDLEMNDVEGNSDVELDDLGEVIITTDN
jgi:hypothetical protein